MVSLLLIISFLIHTLTIIVLFNVMKQLSQLKNNHTSEIDQLLSTYLKEIKSENDRLQKELLQNNVSGQIVPKMTNVKHEENSVKQQNRVINFTDQLPIEEIEQHNEDSDMLETSIEAQALQLYNQGHSVTEIAQKLNRGKTEISLIIDINKRENKNH